MTTLALKNIPDDLYHRLEKVARAKHRSVDDEALSALEKHVKSEEKVADTIEAQSERLGLKPYNAGLVNPNATFRREEIYGDDGR